MNRALAYLFKNKFQFFNVALYVNVMNIIDTLDEIRETTSYLKSESEIKDLGKTRFKIEHRVCGILIHRYACVQKMIRRYNMDKAHMASTPMIGQSVRYKEISISSKG